MPALTVRANHEEGLAALEDLIKQRSQGSRLPSGKEFLGTSDAGAVRWRRIFRKCTEDVAAGNEPKATAADENGAVELDTFKGVVTVDSARTSALVGRWSRPKRRDSVGARISANQL